MTKDETNDIVLVVKKEIKKERLAREKRKKERELAKFFRAIKNGKIKAVQKMLGTVGNVNSGSPNVVSITKSSHAMGSAPPRRVLSIKKSPV